MSSHSIYGGYINIDTIIACVRALVYTVRVFTMQNIEHVSLWGGEWQYLQHWQQILIALLCWPSVIATFICLINVPTIFSYSLLCVELMGWGWETDYTRVCMLITEGLSKPATGLVLSLIICWDGRYGLGLTSILVIWRLVSVLKLISPRSFHSSGLWWW